MLPLRAISRIHTRRLGVRAQSILSPSKTAKEFQVVLDNGTVYVDQAVAEALGWSTDKEASIPLTLRGWSPHYFAITRRGTDDGTSESLFDC